MTEFVRVRHFDSEGGGGLANFAGHIIYFLYSIDYESKILKNIFLKAKRNKHTFKRRGGFVVEVQLDVSCFPYVGLCKFLNFIY